MFAAISCLLASTLSVAQPGNATQGASAARPDALKLFLDCAASCDEDYLRREITVVNYVRDRQDADVHVLLTSQPTGGGGVEFTIQFLGSGRFRGVDQTLTYVARQSSTADEQRSGLAERIKRGLVRYVAETPLAERLRITFAPSEPERDIAAATRDPWNLWVFRTSFTGTFNGERSNTGSSMRLGASASRTSEEWRLSFGTNGSYRHDRFTLNQREEFRSVTKDFEVSALAVNSLSDKWSAGVVAGASSSTFLNYDLRMRAGTGIEYNVFPYAESTSRLLTVQYTVGINRFDYREETIFGQLAEQLADHRLGILYTMVQAWGSAGGQASFTQFLNKPDKYNLSVLGRTSVRLARGFSLNTFATVSRTRDQLYLPRGDATLEEILVRQRQLPTSYRYTMVFGLTYTFGSIFNNVVNPRFGNSADEDF